MFDYKKYKAAIGSAKKAGVFLEEEVNTKEEVYKLLAKTLPAGIEAVKSWTRPGSTGPGDNEQIEKLEQIFDLPDGTLGRREAKPQKEIKKVNKLTDFNKQAIFSCYQIMKNYIHSEEVEDEDCFSNMYQQIDAYKIAIPEDIYEKIQECIDEILAPIVYDRNNTFAQCYTDDIGYWEEDGTWRIRDEEGSRKLCANFMIALIDIEERLDEFAMEVIYPILMK